MVLPVVGTMRLRFCTVMVQSKANYGSLAFEAAHYSKTVYKLLVQLTLAHDLPVYVVLFTSRLGWTAALSGPGTFLS